MKKLALANLPTKIQRLSRWSDECGKNIYVKRDDQTGSEWSGNKIRKLEFAVQEALGQGCNLLITCGGIQSNHCRATVAVAAHLGLKAAVLLRISE
ncbi:MAG: pyridoxal-phosphate dependent enzyme, partial [Bacteroidales bacterium]|nr:pyridoxal-phosphate dependent enzyme [Bacteroidales bacterium]